MLADNLILLHIQMVDNMFVFRDKQHIDFGTYLEWIFMVTPRKEFPLWLLFSFGIVTAYPYFITSYDIFFSVKFLHM